VRQPAGVAISFRFPSASRPYQAGVRCLYLDLDHTLLGRDGSLFLDGAGRFSRSGSAALERCVEAGVEIVIMSGRSRERVRPHAELFGQTAYVFEAGAGLRVEDETYWLTGGLAHRDGRSVYEQIAASGAPELLLEHFGDALTLKRKKLQTRRVTHVFRGHVDIAEADALLAASGHEDLRLLDNGRAYHLAPAGTSKAAGVLRHRELRGYAPEDCVAVGDSREDLGVAPHVGTFWLVANADPAVAADARAHDNVRVARHANGAGVHEAVDAALSRPGAARPAADPSAS
jgi:hydroxymethylpyrimidine pyrophosphatase-like HAD family hydrolase